MVWVCTFYSFYSGHTVPTYPCRQNMVGVYIYDHYISKPQDWLVVCFAWNPMPSLLVTRFFLSTWKAPFWTKRSQKKRTLDDLLYSSNLTSCHGTGISYFFRMALLGVKEKVFDIIMRISITGIWISKAEETKQFDYSAKNLINSTDLKAHYFHICIRYLVLTFLKNAELRVKRISWNRICNYELKNNLLRQPNFSPKNSGLFSRLLLTCLKPQVLHVNKQCPLHKCRQNPKLHSKIVDVYMLAC